MRITPLFLATTLSTVAIVFIVLGSIIFLAGVLLILYFTVWRNLKTAKLVRDTIKTYEGARSLLYGDINKYIKRLEHIASMNLSYSEECAAFKRRYNDLRDTSDQMAENACDQLDGLLDDKKYNDIRAEFDTYNQIISEYVKMVNKLHGSLKQKFQEEEDTNAIFVDLGSKFRSLRQIYMNEQSDLALLSKSFDVVFNNIESCFSEVESDVESANYAKANRILRGTIDPVISELSRVIVNLPNMCLSAQNVLPDRLSSLKYRYEELSKKGYPLKEIIVPQKFKDYEEKIKNMVERLKNFDTDGLQEEIDEMLSSFERCNKALDKEEEASKTFFSEHDGIYKDQQTMENRWVNICHAIPDIKRIFLFSESDESMIEEIKNQIDLSSSTKRALDTYEHSSNKQPYTILVEKMHELRDQTSDCSKRIDEFQNHLSKMKEDVEKANASLPYYWLNIKKAESDIRRTNIEKMEGKYSSSIQTVFDLIDELYEKVSVVPIDVNAVNAVHGELQETAESLFMVLKQDEKSLSEAESAIVFKNRYRNYYSNWDLLKQSEGLFLKGEFEPSLDLASRAQEPSLIQNED